MLKHRRAGVINVILQNMLVVNFVPTLICALIITKMGEVPYFSLIRRVGQGGKGVEKF